MCTGHTQPADGQSSLPRLRCELPLECLQSLDASISRKQPTAAVQYCLDATCAVIVAAYHHDEMQQQAASSLP